METGVAEPLDKQHLRGDHGTGGRPRGKLGVARPPLHRLQHLLLGGLAPEVWARVANRVDEPRDALAEHIVSDSGHAALQPLVGKRV